VPVRLTVCGLPLASSAAESVPVLTPTCVGLNVTETTQPAPGASVAAHVLVWAKLRDTAIAEIFNVAVPLLLSFICCPALTDPTAWFPKVTVDGDHCAVGATPVPVRLTVCGLPVSSSATESVPVRVPVCVGVNVTETMQLAPVASVAAHVLV